MRGVLPPEKNGVMAAGVQKNVLLLSRLKQLIKGFGSHGRDRQNEKKFSRKSKHLYISTRLLETKFRTLNL